MSRSSYLALAAFACSILALPVYADGPAEAPAASGPYQLKNRSSFSAGNLERSPFWPIGFVKAAKNITATPTAPVPTTKLDPGMFAVTSILLGNPSLAVINGRAYGEGEYIRPAKGSGGGAAVRNATISTTARVRVIRIVDGMVTLQATDGQSLAVALRRPELSERGVSAEEEVLLSEQ